MSGRGARPVDSVIGLLPGLIEALPYGVAFYDLHFRYLDVNTAFAAMSGCPREAHVGRHVTEVLPHMAAQVLPCLERALATGSAVDGVNLRGLRNPAADRPGEWVASYVPVTSDGVVTAIAAIDADVTAQRRAEAVVLTQRDVFESCVEGESIASILDHITAAIAEHSSDIAIPSIQLLENGRLFHASAPGLPEEYLKAIDGAAVGPGAGSCGTAAFTNRAVFVTDIATDPLWADYRDVALSHGLR